MAAPKKYSKEFKLDAIVLVVEQKYCRFKLIKKRTKVEHEFDIKNMGDCQVHPFQTSNQ
jgi:hypothetical protein